MQSFPTRNVSAIRATRLTENVTILLKVVRFFAKALAELDFLDLRSRLKLIKHNL